MNSLHTRLLQDTGSLHVSDIQTNNLAARYHCLHINTWRLTTLITNACLIRFQDTCDCSVGVRLRTCLHELMILIFH